VVCPIWREKQSLDGSVQEAILSVALVIMRVSMRCFSLLQRRLVDLVAVVIVVRFFDGKRCFLFFFLYIVILGEFYRIILLILCLDLMVACSVQFKSLIKSSDLNQVDLQRSWRALDFDLKYHSLLYSSIDLPQNQTLYIGSINTDPGTKNIQRSIDLWKSDSS